MTSVLIDSPRIAPRSRAWADDELARAAGRGDVAAFEALYERHHAALLSFARHMLGRLHDAEDVVQHTFAAADAAFREDRAPASVRAWLYTVARNRCISILRSRRDDEELSGLPSAENLAEEVEQREDLRELLADLRALPDDQRAALLLAELSELSHAEVAQVLGVRARKVKALVYQARQALMAAAGARAIPCRSIQAEIAGATGAARRRRHLRDHVARCEGCRSYADRVAAQRASLAAILPVVPTVALRDTVLACIGSGGAAAATGGASAGLGVLGAKLLAITAIGGAAAGGGTVAVTQLERSEREPRPARSAAPARAPAAVAPVVPTRPSAPERGPAPAEEKRGGRRAEPTATRAAPPATGERPGSKPATPPGLARGDGRQQARGKRSAGNARGKPERAAPRSQAPSKSPGPPTAEPVRVKPAPPGQARKPAPARNEPPAPPAQAQPKAKEPKEPQVKTK